MPGCDAAIWEHEGLPEEHPDTPATNNSIADNFQTRENINNSLVEFEPTAFFSEAKRSARESEGGMRNRRAGTKSQGVPEKYRTGRPINSTGSPYQSDVRRLGTEPRRRYIPVARLPLGYWAAP